MTINCVRRTRPDFETESLGLRQVDASQNLGRPSNLLIEIVHGLAECRRVLSLRSDAAGPNTFLTNLIRGAVQLFLLPVYGFSTLPPLRESEDTPKNCPPNQGDRYRKAIMSGTK